MRGHWTASQERRRDSKERDADMKLYGAPASPFWRKTRIVAEELGLLDQIELVEVAASPMNLPAVGDALAANPTRRLPLLELDDGRAVYDSAVICLVLAEMRPGNALLPTAGVERIDALTREALSRNLADSAVAAIYEMRFREPERVFQPWIDAQWAKVCSALDAMTAAAPPAERFDLGDCGWAASLSYLELRYGDRDWRSGRSALIDWYEAAKARPSVAAIL